MYVDASGWLLMSQPNQSSVVLCISVVPRDFYYCSIPVWGAWAAVPGVSSPGVIENSPTLYQPNKHGEDFGDWKMVDTFPSLMGSHFHFACILLALNNYVSSHPLVTWSSLVKALNQ